MTCPAEKLRECPKSLLTSHCPKHKRLGHDQTGFRCICAELEIAYINGAGDERRASSVPPVESIGSEAIKIGCEGLLGPMVKIFAMELRRLSSLQPCSDQIRDAERALLNGAERILYRKQVREGKLSLLSDIQDARHLIARSMMTEKCQCPVCSEARLAESVAKTSGECK